MQTSPVRASVPIGISRQEKISPAANAFTRRSAGNTVPNRASHRIIGMIAIATVEMVLLS
jgi:hypothetical protein